MRCCTVILVTIAAAFAVPVTDSNPFLDGYNVAMNAKDSTLDPDVDRDALHLITSKGYPCEEHQVETEDGCFLTMQRIPHGVNEKKPYNANEARPVVFLQHGLMGSATNWLTNLANESLAYILADAGFDVWLGNMRGNTYSRAHATLDPDKDRKYWAFSWDEMAKHDIPTMLNEAMKVGGAEHVYYVGHSQGTLVGFTGFEVNKELAKKVKHFFALAPVYTIKHLHSGLLNVLGQYAGTVNFIFKLAGKDEFAPNKWGQKWLAHEVCGWNYVNDLCNNYFFQIGGYNLDQVNKSRTIVYKAHNPAGTSTQNMVHFGQMTQLSRCLHYNYGTKLANKRHYGQVDPPEYFVENMTVPLTMFTGDKDGLADPDDVEMLRPRLRSLHKEFKLTNFNHYDFIWGLNAQKEVYAHIIEIVRENEKDHHKKNKKD